MNKWTALFYSRRFWAAVGGVLVIALHDVIGISEDDANKILVIVLGWIFANAYRPTGGKL